MNYNTILMNVKKWFWAAFALVVPIMLNAQEKKDSVMRFSLNEAKTYALTNSPVVKNSTLDLESAKKKIWETTAIGLPQVSAKMSMSYMITVPSFYEQFIKPGIGSAYSKIPANQRPADSIGFVNQQYDKAVDDMRTSGTFDLTVSQLIFSGAYIVGLQTSRVYKGFSELALTKSTTDVTESLSNSYYLVLVAKENKQITDSTLVKMKKIQSDIEAMYKQGFLEESDFDQITITVSNVQSAADMLARQVEITTNLLKYQMGIPFEQKIELTDSLSQLLNSNLVEVSILNGFNVENNVDYKILDTQAKLMNLNVKLQKSAFLPDIAAFYQHEELLNSKSLAFTPPNMIGLSVSVPLFTSGSRLAKIGQAKIGYEKAINTRNQVADGLKIDFENSKSTYLSAKDKYETDKRNFELAKRILNKSTEKYKQGMMGSMDYNQAQTQYLQVQSSYFNSALSLINAKNKLEKLLTPASSNK